MAEETQTTENVEEVDIQQESVKEPNKQEGRTFTRDDVAKMLSAERAKWDKEQEAREAEAKRIAKMNADEKKNYQLSQREQELANREAELARKELMAEAKELLSERGLPTNLANVVDLTDGDSVRESIDSIQNEWEKGVQAGVSERLKGKAPIENAPKESGRITKEQFNKMGYQSRNELFRENPELYKELKG